MDKMQLKIIYYIRNYTNVSLHDLYIMFFGEKKPIWSSTEDILCEYLSNLCDAGIININKRIGDIDEILIPNNYGEEITTGDFLRLALFGTNGLKSEAQSRDISKKIYFSLTNKLYELQRTIGFSISDEIQDLMTREQQEEILGRVSPYIHADVFVAMPFDDAFKSIFEEHIRKVCDRKLLSCLRVDRINRASSIVNDIWSGINNSKVVIADCTGQNANVFYEIGLAHALGKRVILIMQNPDDMPFDINKIRYIKYEYTPDGMKEFDITLSRFLQEEYL